jgi:hypothetical protein
LPGLVVALGTFSCALFRFALFRRRQWNTGAAGLAQADGDGLLWRSCSMLSFMNMFEFLVNELSSGCGRGLSFLEILLSAFNDFFFRHVAALLSSRDAKFARCDISGSGLLTDRISHPKE